MDVCQSCRKNPVELVDDRDNPAYPYRVCNACHDRLISMALRPREYFNLASQHGMTFLLNDDFYDDKGTACAAEGAVMFNAVLAFPLLGELSDLPSVVDYAIVAWHVSDDDDVVTALKQFERQEMLRELDKRLALNKGLLERICLLIALTCGKYAEEWMLQRWAERTDENFSLYAEAMAKCLPSDLGFELYSKQVALMDSPTKLSEATRGLIYFQSKAALPWIEAHIGRVTNISDVWGYLATASQFDWPTAKRWLELGRPLSLVALDALTNCAVTSETQNSLPWLRENPPRLLRPDTVDEMNRLLLQYSKVDTVTRVRSNIHYIMENWTKILK